MWIISKGWRARGKSSGPKTVSYTHLDVYKRQVPLVAISRRPDGGGTDYQPVNLLARGWQESFLCTAEDTGYQLLFDGLAADPVKCEKLAADGSWQTLTEGTDFSVDRAAGRLTFVTAPGESPISGQDNLKVTAFREWAGYAGRIDVYKRQGEEPLAAYRAYENQMLWEELARTRQENRNRALSLGSVSGEGAGEADDFLSGFDSI